MHSLWVHLPFPLGDVLMAQFRSDPATTHPAQWCTSESCSEAHCRQGWETHREGKTTWFFVFLWSVAMTLSPLLIPYLMACLPSLKVWCPGTPSYPKQWVFPLRELVQGSGKVKRRQTQTKAESIAQLQFWYTLPLLSERLPQKLPSLSPQTRNRVHTQLMLIQLSWLKAEMKGRNKG